MPCAGGVKQKELNFKICSNIFYNKITVRTVANLRVLRDENRQIVYADFRRALALSEGRMPSNKTAHEVLTSGRHTLNFQAPLWTPVWTRTMVAYPKAGQPFGAVLEAKDEKGLRYRLDTGEFAGLRNAALVFDGYELDIERGVLVCTPKSAVALVENFPQKSRVSDSFEADGATGLPVAKKGSLAFWRTEEAAILPAVRATYGSSQPAVWLRHGISHEFGVLVEEG
jgi:hypothetical protein